MPLGRVPDQQIEMFWEDFTPTSIVNLATPTINHARLIKMGLSVEFKLNLSGTVSGSPTDINFEFPDEPVATGGVKSFHCLITEDGGSTYQIAVGVINSGVAHIQKDGGAAFANGSLTIVAEGSYEVEPA